MAYEHLRASLTKGNLWLYVLAELAAGEGTPGELKARVESKYGFAPAAITFYTVIYRLRHEGLVRRSSEGYRSAYALTPKGRGELSKAVAYLLEVRRTLASGSELHGTSEGALDEGRGRDQRDQDDAPPRLPDD